MTYNGLCMRLIHIKKYYKTAETDNVKEGIKKEVTIALNNIKFLIQKEHMEKKDGNRKRRTDLG